jgi:CheY-like chemotaxis protein
MLQGLKVLLVEDEASVRNYVARQLRSLGCSVTEVESGPAALHALSVDDSFELLLSDVKLGDGPDGLELARRAQAAFGSGLKVLLTSGYAGGSSEPPGTVVLRKPYHRAQLAEALTRLVGRAADRQSAGQAVARG